MSKSLSERIRAFLPAIGWGLCITVLSLTPGDVIYSLRLEDLFSLDKAGHLFFYAVFVVFIARGFQIIRENGFSGRDIFRSAAIAFSISALFEVLQLLVFVGRDFDVFDLIANIIGCAAGMVSAFWLKKNQLWL